jgi:hypothetical protein
VVREVNQERQGKSFCRVAENVEESSHRLVDFISILDDNDGEVDEEVLQDNADSCCVED